jgi:Indole-3-glycerol phosphate synthase
MSGPGQESVLAEILAGVREDVAERQEKMPLDHVREMAAAAAPPRDGYNALRAPGVGVIAEVKRASPSAGALAAIDDPAELACEYALGGARCVSVLTEQRWFGGSLDDFAAVRAAGGVPAELADLTGRELDVLRAIARGLSNREIGRALHLSEATVKTHVARVLSKLDVRDRVQAVICAHESGLDLDTTPD